MTRVRISYLAMVLLLSLQVMACEECPPPTAAQQSAYATCRASADIETCKANGGEWTTGLGSGESCRCPTQQENCRCTTTSDCLGDCVKEAQGSCICGDGADHAQLCPTGAGICTAYSSWNGCKCKLHQGDEWYAICQD